MWKRKDFRASAEKRTASAVYAILDTHLDSTARIRDVQTYCSSKLRCWL